MSLDTPGNQGYLILVACLLLSSSSSINQAYLRGLSGINISSKVGTAYRTGKPTILSYRSVTDAQPCTAADEPPPCSRGGNIIHNASLSAALINGSAVSATITVPMDANDTMLVAGRPDWRGYSPEQSHPSSPGSRGPADAPVAGSEHLVGQLCSVNQRRCLGIGFKTIYHELRNTSSGHRLTYPATFYISAGVEVGAATDNAGGGTIWHANGRVARRVTSLTAAIEQRQEGESLDTV
jgi:hypothetical protein